MAETMKLKPCPFCGGRATAEYAEHSNIPYKISCSTEGCFMYHWRNYYKEKDAQSVEKWNTRAESKAEPSTAATDSVNHPSHYETNGIECIDAMQAAQGVSAVQDFCICNAFKYIWRHKNGAEDIKKAVWYLNKWLELERWGVKPNEGGVDNRL